jgi:hypothetical protein
LRQGQYRTAARLPTIVVLFRLCVRSSGSPPEPIISLARHLARRPKFPHNDWQTAPSGVTTLDFVPMAPVIDSSVVSQYFGGSQKRAFKFPIRLGVIIKLFLVDSFDLLVKWWVDFNNIFP